MKSQHHPTAGFVRTLFRSSLLLLSLLASTSSPAANTGGFLESDETTVTRPLLTPAQIAAFMPSRGLFSFPAPYGTQGVRITDADDCGGNDCVDMIYSYWKNMSNSAGSNIMYIFVGLDRSRGGQGPTLFQYDKTTDALTELGPLFDPSSPYSAATGEGWYFSYGMPTKMYITNSTQLVRFDVLSKSMQVVFDVTAQWGSDKHIWQTSTSNDDDVHAATLEDSSYQMIGCVAHKESTGQYFYYPKTGDFDECQIDKSGRYLVIKEQIDGLYDVDNVIVDLQTGVQTQLLDQNGAGGHSDLGYGTYVAADNWAPQANTWRLWNLAVAPTQGLPFGVGSLLQGGSLYHDLNWNVFEPSHISYENARSDIPVNQQYACGDNKSAVISPHANEIVCFMLDSSVPLQSQQALVVAPVMTDANASGGNAACPGCEDYAKDPKGNIDPTGQYFFWTSNLGGSRLDAFIVKLPSQLLTGSSGGTGGGTTDTTPPTVSISSPASGSTLTGVTTLNANASDNVAVASVQFQLDGVNLGTALTASPYSLSWDPTTVAAGNHTLTAVATDTSSNTATSTAVGISTLGVTVPPAISAVASSVNSSSAATVSWTTDQTSSSQVAYGTTGAYGSSTTLNTAMTVAHSVALSGLAAGTTYHYQVKSVNASGQQSASGDYSFTTAAASSGGGSTLPNPAGYWKLNASSGATAIDSSGNGYTATLYNSPAWTAGVSGNALSFNGSNQYAAVTGASALNAYPLSVAVWIKTASTSGLHGVVDKYKASSLNGYQIFVNNGNLCAWYFKDSADYVWDGSGCTLSTPGFTDNKWHQVVFTVDATGGKLYVDGVQKASQAWTGIAGATTTATGLNFARYPGVTSPYLPGSLDDVRVYNSALNAAQVATLYNSFVTSQPAVWTNPVNVSLTGNSLQKTGGCDGCEDAGAFSAQELLSGNGSLTFTATETNTMRAAGFSSPGLGTGIANMQYAIRLQSGDAEVRELGVYKADVPFSSGDVFMIHIVNGTVGYYKNGTLFYTSTVAPGYPLVVTASLFNLGSTVTNAIIATK